MNKTQALAKARKLLGPHAQVHVHESVPIGEARTAEIAERRALTERLKAVQEARDVRRNEVLKADAEYQRLVAEAREMEMRRNSLAAGYHYRVTVVADCTIKSGGDNFAEALAAIETKEGAR